MAEELFADIPNEGEDPFKKDEEETETPTESQPENKPEEEEPSSEGEESEEKSKENTQTEEQVPFHKHPRWQELQREREELKQQVQDLTRFREEAAPLLQKQQETQPIPSWFADMFGDDQERWDKFLEFDSQRREQLKQEIFQQQEQFQRQQIQDSQRWDRWVEEQYEGLEGEGLSFDRKELQKIMLEYQPSRTLEDGNVVLDFQKGYEILQSKQALKQAEQSKKVDAKKKVASQTMEGSNSEAPKKNYRIPSELRNKDWSDLAF